MQRLAATLWWAGIFLGCSVNIVGALEPGDIAVIFNTHSPGSLDVARYYMQVRKIPSDHLIPLDCPPAENITAADYRDSVVPQLLQQLRQRKLLADPKAGVPGIKCLVTTYDVPLRILEQTPTPPEKAEIADDQKLLEEVTADIAAHIALYDALAPVPSPPRGATQTAPAGATASSASATAPKSDAPAWQQLLPKVQAAAQAAARRIQRLPDDQRPRAMALFIDLQEHMAGVAGVMGSLSVPADASGPAADQARAHLAALGTQLQDDQKQYQALMLQRDSAHIRKEIISLRLRVEGVIGEARALDETIAYLKPDQTASCFDNELMLLPADQNYPRSGWLVNPNHLEVYPLTHRPGAAPPPPTLLVCRIDGLTPASAKALVDTAVQVEAKGLDGKFYLDARGLRGADAYAAFDADIRKTADWMKAHASIETVLDDTPALLEARDCPAAALYCGWYALRGYHDSGQWVRGAVGYHVASFEMMTLHDPQERGWVSNLLQRGFAGTAGPTDEPYLHSFAKPSQFFPLLLSGEFTQGEVWEVTCPLVSWRQGFVGDPLYNPFKVKPRVKVEDLKADPVLREAFEILGR